MPSLLSMVSPETPQVPDTGSQKLTPAWGGGGGGGGGDGSVGSGLQQINTGAGVASKALGRAMSDLGNTGGGSGLPSQGGGMFPYQSYLQQQASYKKGGSVKKYTKNGKLNLGACGVSTHKKSKKNSCW